MFKNLEGTFKAKESYVRTHAYLRVDRLFKVILPTVIYVWHSNQEN